MKKIVFLVSFLFLVSVGSAHALMLSLEASSTDIIVGNTFSIDLVVSELGDYTSPSVGDFDVDVLYDMTQMTFLGYTMGSYLGDIGLGEAWDFSWGDMGGAIDLAELSLLTPGELDALQPDSFVLASLDFMCDAIGTSVIQIDNSDPLLTYKVSDAYARLFQVQLGGPLTINQAPIPEPTTMLLMATGLAGLAGTRLRRKEKKA